MVVTLVSPTVGAYLRNGGDAKVLEKVSGCQFHSLRLACPARKKFTAKPRPTKHQLEARREVRRKYLEGRRQWRRQQERKAIKLLCKVAYAGGQYDRKLLARLVARNLKWVKENFADFYAFMRNGLLPVRILQSIRLALNRRNAHRCARRERKARKYHFVAKNSFAVLRDHEVRNFLVNQEDEELVSSRRVVAQRQRIMEDWRQIMPFGWVHPARPFDVCAHRRERLLEAKASNDYEYLNLLDKFKFPEDFRNVTVQAIACTHEMDAHGEGGVTTTRAANTLLTAGEGSSTDSAMPLGRWQDYVTEDVSIDVGDMSNNYHPYRNYEWTKDHSSGTFLNDESIELPRALLLAKNKDAYYLPRFAPFAYHQYVELDMEIRIQVNSNRMQIGQLQASWYYGADMDASFEHRRNVYNLSQTMHALIDAGGSNEAILKIPFRYVEPVLACRDRKSFPRGLVMGVLNIAVLNPLLAPSGAPDSASVGVFVRLTPRFTGAISSNLPGQICHKVSHEMETAAVMAAMRLVDQIAPDPNRDNPPTVAPPQFVVPTAAHSWSIGTGAPDPVHPLRLDATGQTHHPGALSSLDYQTTNDIASVFGLIGSFSWKTDYANESSLWKWSADPFKRIQDFPTMLVDSKAAYNLPPVAVIASMFAQWRGSLEFRFDIVASQFHTGRLMCAFIPGYDTSQDVTFTQARAGNYAIFDLQSDRTFSYIVPYVNRSMWHRRNNVLGSDELYRGSPGQLQLFVYNKLVTNNAIAPQVYVNVYMRAGTTFETAVPVQPSIGLCYNMDYHTPDLYTALAREGMYPYGVGTWDKKGFPKDGIVMRWGLLAGRVTEFDVNYHRTTRHDYYWQIQVVQAEFTYYDLLTNTVLPCKYGVVISIDDINVMALCANKKNAKLAFQAVAQGKPFKDYVAQYLSNPGNTYCSGNPRWMLSRDSKEVGSEEEYVHVGLEGERDVSEVALNVTTPIASTLHGRFLYGEVFNRICDLMRRYQLAAVIRLPKIEVWELNRVLFSFPSVPQGLALDIGPNEQDISHVFNVCRDGITPILMSAFKFMRGSMRYRIVMPPIRDAEYWVQHRPDEVYIDNTVATYADSMDADCIRAHGYATYVQFANVNGVLEFEIPFYQTGLYGCNGKWDEDNDVYRPYQHLGQIVVGLNCPASELPSVSKGAISVYSAIADDFSVNTFQGFPPMMDPSGIVNVAHEGISDLLGTGRLADVVGGASAEMRDKMDAIFDKIGAHYSAHEWYDYPLVRLILTEALLLAVYPTKEMLVGAMCSLLAVFGLDLILTIAKTRGILYDIWSVLTGPGEELNGSNATFEGPTEDNERFCSWVAILWTGVSTLLGFKNSKSPDFASYFTREFGFIARSSNSVLAFLKANISVLMEMFYYCAGKVNPWVKWLIDEDIEHEVLKAWVAETEELLSFGVRTDHLGDRFVTDRLTSAISVGREFLTSFDDLKVHTRYLQMISQTITKLEKTLDEHMSAGEYPYVRKECFGIYIVGAPGLGKSTMITPLATRLLSDAEIAAPPNMICNINIADNYWSSCNGRQPVAVVDDIWQLETPDAIERQVKIVFGMMSPCPLQPVMADLPDKKMRYNPELFIMTSNREFPAISGINTEALWRRRHILVKVEATPLTPGERPNCLHCAGKSLEETNPASLQDYHHLKFLIADNPRSPATTWKSYDYNGFLMVVSRRFVAFRNRENEMYNARIRAIESISTDLMCSRRIDKIVSDLRAKKTARVNAEIEGTLKGDLGSLWESLKGYFLWTSEAPKKTTEWIPKYRDGQVVIEAKQEGFWIKKPDPTEVPRVRTIAKKRIIDAATCVTKLVQNTVDEGLEESIRVAMNNVLDKGWPVATVMMATNPCPFELLNASHFWVWCDHTKFPLDEIEWDDGGWTTGHGAVLLPDRCKNQCILACEHTSGWLRSWLRNGSLRTEYLRKRKFERLPPEVAAMYGWRSSGPLFTKERLNDLCENIKQRVHSIELPAWFKQVWDFLKKVGPKLLKVLGFLAVILGAVGGAASVFCAGRDIARINGWMDKKCENTSGPFDGFTHIDQERSQYDVRSARTVKAMGVQTSKLEATSQQTGVVMRRLRDNALYLVAHLKTGNELKFRVLALGGREILVIRHFVEAIDELRRRGTLDSVGIRYVHEHNKRINVLDNIPIEINCTRVRWYKYGENDADYYNSNLGIFELPPTVQQFKNLRQFISPQASHNYVTSRGLLVEDQFVRDVNITKSTKIPYMASGTDGTSKVLMQDTYTYGYHGEGVCGSVLLCPDLQYPIIAIHVAGSCEGKGFGISEPLVGESFGYEPSERRPVVDVAEMHLLPVELATIDIDSVIYPKGVVPTSLSIHQSSETQFVPSLIHGTVEVRTEPAPLHVKDSRLPPNSDPMTIGCRKHGMISEIFPSQEIKAISKHYEATILDIKPVKLIDGPLSLQDAVCGNANVPEINALEWSSSEGFPLSKQRPTGVTGKKWLFDLEETPQGLILKGMNEELSRLYSVQMEMRRRGIRPQTIFVDCLKDCLLPLEKCRKSGGTRVFSTAPVQYVIAFRQYFGDYMAAFRRARFDAEHGIGMSVNSREWTVLAILLQQNGKHIIAGDYSHYGYTLNAGVLKEAFALINKWYARYSTSDTLEEDQRIRGVLAEEILNVCRLAKNFVYQSLCGIPSGFPMTDVMNTMVNSLYIRSAWYNLAQQHGLYLHDFKQHVKLITYGDDMIANISEKAAEFFTSYDLFEFFKSRNIKFTDIDKSGEFVKLRTLENAPFLKCNFKPHPTRNGIYLAALDEISVEQTMNWIHGCDDPLEATRVNCEATLRAAFGHGPEYYNSLKNKIIRAFQRIDQSFTYYEWDDLDHKIFALSK